MEEKDWLKIFSAQNQIQKVMEMNRQTERFGLALTQEEARLQEIFYTFKNETLDEITDDELLEFMREQYEEKCCGDTEYMEGTFLSDFAQMVRSGK
ncbi:MAG: hypothetical protein J6C12_07240 [Lachnospiraceae bacterium]|nr:hypothetical protein [Lachnospiraceae bacterium]